MGAAFKKQPSAQLKRFPHDLRLVYEDGDIIVVEKARGLLSCDIEGGSRRNALDLLSCYLRKGQARSRLRAWLVHRLDRETSGLMVFAKSFEACNALKASWGNNEKYYRAVVEGVVEPQEGVLENWLVERGDYSVKCFDEEKSFAKYAKTSYRILKTFDTPGGKRSLVDVRLWTGRKHQIRVQFARIGHPLAGDVRYNRNCNRKEPLQLVARKLAFDHPSDGRRMVFELPDAEDFTN